ncbi:MAG TPA: DUF4340 domain-containing protein [Phycisphaerales bacterium]|nr:DUF4340 domain-containing protein [Phycisphaerales bacterium]
MSKLTIATFVLAMALVAYVMFTQPGSRSSEVKTGEGAPLFAKSELPVDDISRMTLARKGEATLVFERTKSGWMQTQPFQCPMDSISVQRLAAAAADLRVKDTSKSETASTLTAENVLLSPPLAEVTYEWPGHSIDVELGRKGLAGLAYVRVKGSDVIEVVNQSLHERALGMDPKEWRDRAIFHDIGPEADKIEREDSPTAHMVLVRERKTWKMLMPVETRVDQAALNDYLDALGRAQFAGVLFDQAEAIAQFGLSPAQATLSVTTSTPGQAARVQVLSVGAKCIATAQDRFAMSDSAPIIWQLAPQALAALFRPIQNFIEPTGAGVNPADVKQVVIRTAEGQFTMQRDLDKWVAPEKGGVEVNAALANELMDQLTKLRASAIDVREYPREEEIATVTLYGFDLKAITTVRIAREKDSGKLIMENGDNVLRVYPASLQMKLTAGDFGVQ